MGKHEQGYVTLTVAGLLTTLSIIAISLSHLSMTRAEHVGHTIGEIILDIELESALNQEIAQRLANLSHADGLLSSAQRRGENFSISIEFSDVGSKLNILEASPDVLDRKWVLLNLTRRQIEQLNSLISDLQVTASSEGYQVYSKARESWDEYLIACFNEHLTIFKSPRRLVTAGTASQRLDGMMLQARLTGTHSSGAARGLLAVILITGRRDDPYWVFDWHQFNPSLTGECL